MTDDAVSFDHKIQEIFVVNTLMDSPRPKPDLRWLTMCCLRSVSILSEDLINIYDILLNYK